MTYDSALEKLTGAGCARKKTGGLHRLHLQGQSAAVRAVGTAEPPAHASFMIAEADPGGQNMYGKFTRWFYDRSKPQTEELHAAQSKWARGLEYLPASQLR